VLRRFPRPIQEYADEKMGLLQGSIFIFANGTNLEILLLLEAAKSDDAEQWQFGCAPLSTARLEAGVGEPHSMGVGPPGQIRLSASVCAFGVPLEDVEK
jgi:hypothetical protein